MTTNARNERLVKFNVVLQDAYILDAAGYKKIEGLYDLGKSKLAEFYHRGDDLFVKYNGQIEEAMEYKGNNSFEGGLGQFKAHFDILPDNVVKVQLTYLDDNNKFVNVEGTKLIKVPSLKVNSHENYFSIKAIEVFVWIWWVMTTCKDLRLKTKEYLNIS